MARHWCILQAYEGRASSDLSRVGARHECSPTTSALSMASADALPQGREYFERQAWRDAHDRLSAAAAQAPLSAEDLERLAACAYMLGDEVRSSELLERAHHEFLKQGKAEPAAHCAFRLGFELMMRGMIAPGS